MPGIWVKFEPPAIWLFSNDFRFVTSFARRTRLKSFGELIVEALYTDHRLAEVAQPFHEDLAAALCSFRSPLGPNRKSAPN
jgi:hypothetical protein